MTDSGEWPQTVRIGGREYDVHPQMTMAEFTEVTQRLQNEIEPLLDVMDALGLDVDVVGDDDA